MPSPSSRVLRRVLGRFGLLLLVIVVGSVVTATMVVAIVPVGKEVHDAGDLWLDKESDPSTLPPIEARSKMFDSRGNLIAVLHSEINREPVRLDQIPQPVRTAVLASEDDNFYEHEGFDLQAVGRAFVANLESGGIAQGGSTITQQVVKQTFLSSEQSIDRKVKEAFMAVRLERRLSKDQILERYLNGTYFGNGAYGVQAAAQLYWGKASAELTLADGALLAGIIPSPSRYDPLAHPEASKERRHTVGQRMVELGWITPAQAAEIDATPLPTQAHHLVEVSATTDYFVEAVKQELLDREDIIAGDKTQRTKTVFNGGLNIYTTLDPDLQAVAEDVVGSVKPNSRYTAALASVDVKSGAVLAIHGGANFGEKKFNLATQGKRQTGSSFKPFDVIAALENGGSPNDMYGAGSCSYKGDKTGKGVAGPGGSMTLWQGLAQSVNCVFVNVVNNVGPQAIVDVAHKLGIKSQLDAYPSIALGGLTRGVSPLEMAGAYATIANGGVRHDTHMVTRITDYSGIEIYNFGNGHEEQVIDPNVAYTTIGMMKDVIREGTGRKNAQIGRPEAGKTGTTNGKKDAWFVGFTPQIATAVWVGNPNAASYTGFFGGDLPAALWASYMRQATADLPADDWPAPDLGAFRNGRCVGGCSSDSGSGSGSGRGGTVLQGGGVGLGGND
ncbi:MAG: PBP1A family penicillin-binding protein [Acidimicrobiia bacterium]